MACALSASPTPVRRGPRDCEHARGERCAAAHDGGGVHVPPRVREQRVGARGRGRLEGRRQGQRRYHHAVAQPGDDDAPRAARGRARVAREAVVPLARRVDRRGAGAARAGGESSPHAQHGVIHTDTPTCSPAAAQVPERPAVAPRQPARRSTRSPSAAAPSPRASRTAPVRRPAPPPRAAKPPELGPMGACHVSAAGTPGGPGEGERGPCSDTRRS